MSQCRGGVVDASWQQPQPQVCDRLERRTKFMSPIFLSAEEKSVSDLVALCACCDAAHRWRRGVEAAAERRLLIVPFFRAGKDRHQEGNGLPVCTIEIVHFQSLVSSCGRRWYRRRGCCWLPLPSQRNNRKCHLRVSQISLIFRSVTPRSLPASAVNVRWSCCRGVVVGGVVADPRPNLQI
ncbi:hypothetical protein IG631_00841 [Alternaria alternata]|nr:hypothetical protein IG631_00841 [Alternaria alternata]